MSRFLQNTGNYLLNYTASHIKRPQSYASKYLSLFLSFKQYMSTREVIYSIERTENKNYELAAVTATTWATHMLIHTTFSWDCESSPSGMSLGSSFTFTKLTKLSFSAESAMFITDVMPGNRWVSDDIRIVVSEMLCHI